MSFTGFQLGLSDDLLEASKKVIESSAEYKKFFDATLKKFGVTSPDELSDEKKKEFFDYIDKNYNSDDEKGKDGKVEGYGKKKAVKEAKNAKFLELKFRNKNEAIKAYRTVNNKIFPGGTQPFEDFVQEGSYLQFDNVQDVKGVLNALKKGGLKFKIEVQESLKEDSDKRAGDPCWKGYKQVGMKKKDGKEVPNCVPMNEEELKEAGIDKSDVDYSHLEEEE